MRQIKFKAWVKDKKVMIKPIIGIDFAENFIFGVVYEGDRIKLNDTEILQFTGLKDENGDEIYEGDILGYGDNYPCVVEWNNDESKFEAVEYGNKDGVRRHNMDAYVVKWIILGNKFQDAELLKKEIDNEK